jgi:hypothetical protein
MGQNIGKNGQFGCRQIAAKSSKYFLRRNCVMLNVLTL